MRNSARSLLKCTYTHHCAPLRPNDRFDSASARFESDSRHHTVDEVRRSKCTYIVVQGKQDAHVTSGAARIRRRADRIAGQPSSRFRTTMLFTSRGPISLALVSPSQPRAPNPPRADSGAAASTAAWTLDSNFFWVYSQGFDCLFQSFSVFNDNCQLGQRSGGPGPGPRASGASVSAKVCLAPQAAKW